VPCDYSFRNQFLRAGSLPCAILRRLKNGALAEVQKECKHGCSHECSPTTGMGRGLFHLCILTISIRVSGPATVLLGKQPIPMTEFPIRLQHRAAETDRLRRSPAGASVALSDSISDAAVLDLPCALDTYSARGTPAAPTVIARAGATTGNVHNRTAPRRCTRFVAVNAGFPGVALATAPQLIDGEPFKWSIRNVARLVIAVAEYPGLTGQAVARLCSTSESARGRLRDQRSRGGRP
jgi:hypothetical protein